MFEITDSEIERVERLLLPNDAHFDDERRTAIKCLDTCDILACPGSGKTTVLLAKLLILANKMPFEGNKGICVLTHTNVAIDDIKKRASVNASKLFNYPNHFGTIQSFVDKYLAIPAYINKFNKRPLAINNEFYFDRMERLRKYLGKKTNAFCYKSGQKNFPYSLKFEDFTLDENSFCETLKLDTSNSEQKEIYDKLLRLKNQLLSDGVLIYDDAYVLAKCYIEKYSNLKNVFSARFIFVFIDEMQDSSTQQSELFELLFNSTVRVQKIGDLNQSIFDYDADLECGWTINEGATLCLTGSKRFSDAIANSVQKLCVHQQTIMGNGRKNDITPVIIVYDNSSIGQVLDKFGELIIANDLHLHPDRVFKAVGWRGKPHERERTIPIYWTRYSKEIKVRRTEFNKFKSYLTPQSDNFISSSGVKFYKTRIIDAFLKCLRIVNITDDGSPFTEKSLYRRLIETNEDFHNNLRLKIANWCLRIHKQEDVFEEVKNFLSNEFKQIFNYTDNNELTNFVNNSNMEEDEQVTLESSNIYPYSNGTIKIEIEVSTIHNVKGETHTATCYLETFYYDYDIGRIIGYMEGKYTVPTQKRTIQNLKMVFVGMSRPSHLLCVAAHKDSVSGHEELLCQKGWEINTDLIKKPGQDLAN